MHPTICRQKYNSATDNVPKQIDPIGGAKTSPQYNEQIKQ